MTRMYEQVNSDEADPAHIGSRIDPVLARSWLLVNGAHADRFEAAARSRADVVVLDIEDAVAPKDKAAARDNVVRWLGDDNTDERAFRTLPDAVTIKIGHLPETDARYRLPDPGALQELLLELTIASELRCCGGTAVRGCGERDST